MRNAIVGCLKGAVILMLGVMGIILLMIGALWLLVPIYTVAGDVGIILELLVLIFLLIFLGGLFFRFLVDGVLHD